MKKLNSKIEEAIQQMGSGGSDSGFQQIIKTRSEWNVSGFGGWAWTFYLWAKGAWRKPSTSAPWLHQSGDKDTETERRSGQEKPGMTQSERCSSPWCKGHVSLLETEERTVNLQRQQASAETLGDCSTCRGHSLPLYRRSLTYALSQVGEEKDLPSFSLPLPDQRLWCVGTDLWPPLYKSSVSTKDSTSAAHACRWTEKSRKWFKKAWLTTISVANIKTHFQGFMFQ